MNRRRVGASDMREHSDVGTLSAGVVAAILSLLMLPGEYAVVNLGVSIVILLTTIAYSWQSKRTGLQSVALSSVIALSAIPGMGFVDEVIRFPGDRLGFLVGATEWNCEHDPCSRTGEHRSRVPDSDMVGG